LVVIKSSQVMQRPNIVLTSKSRPPRSGVISGGFTLPEIVIVVLIIVVLATMTVPLFNSLRDKADKNSCVSNMKTLHIALQAYVDDNRQWPQQPEKINRDNLWAWWIKELEPYDVGQKYWLCPSHMRDLTKRYGSDVVPATIGTYVPTDFDAHESTPYRWRQPWIIEPGYHGHTLMPDGSVAVNSALEKPEQTKSN